MVARARSSTRSDFTRCTSSASSSTTTASAWPRSAGAWLRPASTSARPLRARSSWPRSAESVMRAFVLDGEAVTGTESFEEIKSAYEAKKRLWVDLGDETAESRALLKDVFAIHPIAIEDVWGECEAPKAEDYG